MAAPSPVYSLAEQMAIAKVKARKYRQKSVGAPWSEIGRPSQQPPDGDWRFWLLMAGRGFGKALALDTPIPTPNGWTTMGDIRVGDELYDERGMVCRVTFVTPIQINRTCYDVVFSDGTIITADAEHRWLTTDRRTRKALSRRTGVFNVRPQNQPTHAPKVVTTQEIRDTLRDGREVNHAITNADPIWGPITDLPIDPYVFGVWLGDGSSKSAEITTADEEVVDFVRAAGYVIGTRRAAGGRSFTVAFSTGDAFAAQRDGTTGRYVSVEGNVLSDLRTLGVYQNKHIPTRYLRASVDQRLALLQGLMDTDGSVTPGGHAEYVTTTESLFHDVQDLIVGLGFKVTAIIDRATLNGVDCGERFRLTFTPHRAVFRLPRKAERQHTGKNQAARVNRRYIVGVHSRASVPVRCIQVDSPSHLFLASHSMIPTHNTRTGAEYICGEIFANRTREIMLIAATTTDVRDIVVEGPSGIMKTAERIGLQANYEPSKMRVTFGNGAIARTRGADEPDRIRGPECDLAWWDEFGTWKKSDAFTNADFGLRRRGPNGERARAVVSFTPKPTGLVRQLVKRTKDEGEMIADAVLRIGSTYENADNLDAATLSSYRRQYEGTRLGRQELAGELLEDVEGALWTLSLIDDQRIPVPLGKSAMQVMAERGIELSRVVVGVDPPASSTGAECGIVVMARGSDKRGYVLADRSKRGTPNEWANAAVAAFDEFNADAVVIEVNQGGDMATNTLRTIRPRLPITSVHASRGKATRAEPVSSLYQQGHVSHVGSFPALEDQMCTWVQGEASPDRMDALVWAATETIVNVKRGGAYGFS